MTTAADTAKASVPTGPTIDLTSDHTQAEEEAKQRAELEARALRKEREIKMNIQYASQ